MAIKKTIDIDVNSSNAEKNISKVNGSLNNLSDAAIKAKDASKEFGLINDGTAETLTKVQTGAETAVSTYKSFSGVLKSFGILQKITTAAQYVWNAAMAANPIGAIVAVVVSLIAAGYALVKMFQSSSEAAQASAVANKKLNQELQTQIELQKKLLIESELQRDSQLKMAKASGASAKEIRKLSEELANQEVAQKVANAETLKAIFLEARRVAGLEEATEAQKETAKNAYKAFQDANKQAEDAILNRRKLAIDNRVAERQEQTDANKKEKEAQDKQNNELLAQKQKLKDDAKKINEESIANNLKNTQTELEQIESEYKRKKELLISQKVSTEALEIEYLNKINDIKVTNQNKEYEIEQKKIADKKALDEKLNAEKIEKEDAQFLKLKELTLSKDDFEKLQLVQKYENEYKLAEGNAELQLALKQKLSADIKAIDDKDAENKKILQQQEIESASQTFGILADLLGKQSKAGKAFAVAQALINTYQGITAGVKLGYPQAIPAVLAASVTGFKAVKDILKTDPKSSGASSASPSSSGGGGTATPQFNLVGQSSTNQLAQTIATQQKQPIKTYVVAGDVSTQQALDRNAVQTSTFGN